MSGVGLDIVLWVVLVVTGYIGLSTIPDQDPNKAMAIGVFTALAFCSGALIATELKRGKP